MAMRSISSIVFSRSVSLFWVFESFRSRSTSGLEYLPSLSSLVLLSSGVVKPSGEG